MAICDVILFPVLMFWGLRGRIQKFHFSFKLGSQCLLAWDENQWMVVQREGGVIWFLWNRLWARWNVRLCDVHQEPWITTPFRTSFISSLSLWVLICKGFLLLQSLVPLSPNVLNQHMWKQFPLSFGRCQFTSVRDRLVFTLHWQVSWT